MSLGSVLYAPITDVCVRYARFCIHQYAGSNSSHNSGASWPNGGYKRLPANGVEQGDIEQANVSLDAASGANLSSHTSDDTEDQPKSRSGDFFSVASNATHPDRNIVSTSADPLNSKSPAFSTFIGLLFHALADGISLGAASMSTTQSPGGSASDSGGAAGLSFVIFVSLIAHKAPVAISLSSLLLSFTPGASIRNHYNYLKRALVLFSLATPIGALATWILLKIITVASWSDSMDESAEEDGNIEGILAGNMRGRLEFWSKVIYRAPGPTLRIDACSISCTAGIALLFSAGTFLFVSTHVMVDMEGAMSQQTSSPPSTHAVSGASTISGEVLESMPFAGRISKRSRVLLFLAGMATPVLLSVVIGGHHH